MDPRDILQQGQNPVEAEDRLRILVDTESMNEELADGNNAASRVLQYAENDEFRFVRTPETQRDEALERITPYSMEIASNGAQVVKVENEKFSSTHLFGYQEEDIRGIAARVYSEDINDTPTEVEDVTDRELSTVQKVFVQSAFNSHGEGHLFVTNRSELLSNRRWFESHFPGGQLNIMSLRELVEYLGLYLRYRDQFYVGPRFTTGSFGWYWALFRSLVPYYHVREDADDDYMRGFSTRFQNLLTAIDEIGYQYFREPNNETKSKIQYHFDYAISLITGVFDTLALKTAERYDINGIRKEFISLSNNRGREFLNEVRNSNNSLREHISDHMSFINLIYVLRPLVVHRGGYPESMFEDRNEEWIAGGISLGRFNESDRKSFERHYREIDDEPLPYDPITKWGKYRKPGIEFLEPYHFMKSAIRRLVLFSNEYLQSLGNQDLAGESANNRQKTRFSDLTESIRQNGLTYLYDVYPEINPVVI